MKIILLFIPQLPFFIIGGICNLIWNGIMAGWYYADSVFEKWLKESAKKL